MAESRVKGPDVIDSVIIETVKKKKYCVTSHQAQLVFGLRAHLWSGGCNSNSNLLFRHQSPKGVRHKSTGGVVLNVN